MKLQKEVQKNTIRTGRIQDTNSGQLWIGKINTLLNPLHYQVKDDIIDKIFLYTKDAYERKYQREQIGQKCLEDPKTFMEYSNDIQNMYKSIGDYNSAKKRKTLQMVPPEVFCKKSILRNFSKSPVPESLF